MTAQMLWAQMFPGPFVKLLTGSYADHRDVIITAMARALFVLAYADQEEEAGRHIGPRDWMDVAPPTSANAWYSAVKLATQIEKLNAVGLSELYGACALYQPEKHAKPATAADFGHYLALQSCGTGVGWHDDHPDPGIQLPHWEFHL